MSAVPHVNFRMGWPSRAIVAISCSIRLRSRYRDSRHSTAEIHRPTYMYSRTEKALKHTEELHPETYVPRSLNLKPKSGSSFPLAPLILLFYFSLPFPIFLSLFTNFLQIFSFLFFRFPFPFLFPLPHPIALPLSGGHTP